MFTGYLTRKAQKGAWRLASGVVQLGFDRFDLGFDLDVDICPLPG